MKKILLALLFVGLGVAADRGAYSLGMHLGQKEIDRCGGTYKCYDNNYWKLASYLTWYYIEPQWPPANELEE